jgi:hypothetical protein
MIQLANDPNASRMNFRPAANDGQVSAFQLKRRTGHAWPFLSRETGRPASQDAPKPSSNDSGS